MRKLPTYDEFINESNSFNDKLHNNLLERIGEDYKSFLEGLDPDKQYFWALHADLYDKLSKSGDPVKTAREMKIKDRRRQDALKYFLGHLLDTRAAQSKSTNKVKESMMSDIHMHASDAKDFEDFLKRFLKADPDNKKFVGDKESKEMLRQLYNDSKK